MNRDMIKIIQKLIDLYPINTNGRKYYITIKQSLANTEDEFEKYKLIVLLAKHYSIQTKSKDLTTSYNAERNVFYLDEILKYYHIDE